MSQQEEQQNERNYASMMAKVFNWLREYQKRPNGNWLVFTVGRGKGFLEYYLFGGHGGKTVQEKEEGKDKIGYPNRQFSVAVMFNNRGMSYRGLSLTFKVDKTYSRFNEVRFSIFWGTGGNKGRNTPDPSVIELGKKFKISGKKIDFNFSKSQCEGSKPIIKFKSLPEDEEVKEALYNFLDENAESFKAIPDGLKLDETETNDAIEQRIVSLKQLGLVAADPKGDLFVPDSADYLVMLKADMADGGEEVAEQTDKPIGDARGRNVIILRWNPYEKEEDGRPKWKDYERALKSIKTGRPWKEDWSCHTKKVAIDDEVYVYKASNKKQEIGGEGGIVAHGKVISNRAVEGKGGRIDVELDSMVDYTCEDYVTWSKMKMLSTNGSEVDAKALSDHRESGFPLPDAFDEEKIAEAWNSLLDMKSKELLNDLVKEDLNLIRFGAPGTGKSFEINKKYENVGWSSKERVTFHPDYSYANFVGSYKPYMKNEKKIAYAFVPGPFTRVLVNALRDPNGKHLLVIEEINRANTAAVFGDVFQLLDRGEDGKSEYAISPSQDLAKFLREALKKTKPTEKEMSDNRDIEDDWWWLTKESVLTDEKGIGKLIRDLRIPSNMYLWATMNSADQGVFPMDTAFKRRWSFEYVKINDGQGKLNSWGPEDSEGKTLGSKWNDLRCAINEKLLGLKVNEDKCMGPFFLAKGDLKDINTFLEVFKSKVLMYLFEDAARQKRSNVFSDGLVTLSKIFGAVNERKSVFKDGDIDKKLKEILALKKDDQKKSTTEEHAEAGGGDSAQQKSQESSL